MSQNTLDLRGLCCPMPVLRTKKVLAKMQPEEVLVVKTDDPHAVADIALFIEQSGHVLKSQQADPTTDGVTVHTIERRKE
ncbi:MAG: sulfurtransferase TusA family protein [Duodenibacillus sp.]|nr:sulfurtransferase TusA family protein [Duodenibacillus sp.]